MWVQSWQWNHTVTTTVWVDVRLFIAFVNRKWYFRPLLDLLIVTVTVRVCYKTPHDIFTAKNVTVSLPSFLVPHLWTDLLITTCSTQYLSCTPQDNARHLIYSFSFHSTSLFTGNYIFHSHSRLVPEEEPSGIAVAGFLQVRLNVLSVTQLRVRALPVNVHTNNGQWLQCSTLHTLNLWLLFMILWYISLPHKETWHTYWGKQKQETDKPENSRRCLATDIQWQTFDKTQIN